MWYNIPEGPIIPPGRFAAASEPSLDCIEARTSTGSRVELKELKPEVPPPALRDELIVMGGTGPLLTPGGRERPAVGCGWCMSIGTTGGDDKAGIWTPKIKIYTIYIVLEISERA